MGHSLADRLLQHGTRNNRSAQWRYFNESMAYNVFTIVLAAASVLSIATNMNATSGVRSTNPESRRIFLAQAIFCWSYPIASILRIGGIGIITYRFDLSCTATAVLYNFVVPLLLGIIYWLGAGTFNDKTMLFSGTWMMLLSWSTILLGIPAGYLAMAIVDGGGLLVAAIVSAVLTHHNALTSTENLLQGHQA